MWPMVAAIQVDRGGKRKGRSQKAPNGNRPNVKDEFSNLQLASLNPHSLTQAKGQAGPEQLAGREGLSVGYFGMTRKVLAGR